MGTSLEPGIYDPELADERLEVGTERARDMAQRLSSEEGILVGVSAGAAMSATLDLATRIGRGVFVTVFADNGTRYLSDEGLFQ